MKDLYAKRGTELPQSKLTDDQVQQIRAVYAQSKQMMERWRKTGTVRGLAKIYGVDPTTISHVLNHATWMHVR